jgi:hypothetical protein
MEKSQLCVASDLNTTRSICILSLTLCCIFTGLRYDITYSHVAEAGQSTANGDLIHPQMQGYNEGKRPQVAEQIFLILCPLGNLIFYHAICHRGEKRFKKHFCYNPWRIKLNTLFAVSKV